MEKLNDEKRMQIIQLCKLDSSKENIKRVATDYNITTRYIYKLLKSETAKELSTLNNTNEFTKKANEIMQIILDRLEEKILTDDKTTLTQLSTTLGILYDKSRLENNLSTENKAININIKIE